MEFPEVPYTLHPDFPNVIFPSLLYHALLIDRDIIYIVS